VAPWEGSSETKIAGKANAIFGLEQGMWLELTEKSQAKVDLGGVPGMSKKDYDMNIILKYEMERKQEIASIFLLPNPRPPF